MKALSSSPSTEKRNSRSDNFCNRVFTSHFLCTNDVCCNISITVVCSYSHWWLLCMFPLPGCDLVKWIFWVSLILLFLVLNRIFHMQRASRQSEWVDPGDFWASDVLLHMCLGNIIHSWIFKTTKGTICDATIITRSLSLTYKIMLRAEPLMERQNMNEMKLMITLSIFNLMHFWGSSSKGSCSNSMLAIFQIK